MSFKDISIFSSGGHFVHRSETILASLVAGHSKNIFVKLFKIWPLVYENMLFKDFISY